MHHKLLSCGMDHPWQRSPYSLPWVSTVIPPHTQEVELEDEDDAIFDLDSEHAEE